MAAPQQPGVALTLERCATDLFAITVGLAPPPGGWDAAEASSAGDEEAQPLLPPPLPPRCAALNRSLAALRALATPALPFAAHPLGQDQLRVVTPRAHTAAVFKLLRAQQGALGIVVGDLKSCVAKPPLPRDELEAAAAAAVLAGLLHRGWHQLDEDRVLGASVLAPAADAAPQVCGSLTLRVRAEGDGTSTLRLLVRAEEVRFRHPASHPSGNLVGAQVTLLPAMQPALVERLRPADEATLARLRPLWQAYGMPLPDEALQHLVEVRLDEDPDAPTFPYPPSRVLGQFGLEMQADRLHSPGVQAVLARLRDDLAATPFKALGDEMRVAPMAHEWWADGAPPAKGRDRLASAAPALAFTTARQLAEQGKGGREAPQLALGAELRVADFATGAAGGGAGAGTQPRQRRPHAVASAELQAAMEAAKLLHAEAEGRPAASAKPAAAPGAAGPSKPPQPLALRQASAAAAAGSTQKPAVPLFKKIGGAVPAAPKKAAAGKAGKRPAAGKPPAGAKKAKAAAAPALAPGGAAAGGLAPSAAANASAPPSAAKGEAAAAAARASTAAEGAGMGAAAPAKAAKPRAKAADIDIAAVTAKAQQAHAAGTLGKLTIPELKAYLKSMGRPVGGKKGELEERARAALGGGAAGGTAAAAQ